MIMKDYAEPFATKKRDTRDTLEGIVLTFLGVVCYLSSGFLFGYAILGGF